MIPNGSACETFLPLSVDQQIDAVCTRFERDWLAGLTPCLEDFLEPATGAEREELFRQLLRVELAYRRQRGEPVFAEHYLARFPAHTALLRAEIKDAAGALAPEPGVPGYEICGR